MKYPTILILSTLISLSTADDVPTTGTKGNAGDIYKWSYPAGSGFIKDIFSTVPTADLPQSITIDYITGDCSVELTCLTSNPDGSDHVDAIKGPITSPTTIPHCIGSWSGIIAIQAGCDS